MKSYSQVFIKEEEGYTVIVPELPGCSAFGKTKEEAKQELHHAIKAWIEAAKSAGNPIPTPKV